MSVIPALRKQILDRLEQRPALAGVQLSYGVAAEWENEAIAIGGPDPTDTQWVSMGGDKPRDDFFSIPIAIQVRHYGDTAFEADIRADQMLDEIYAMVREAKNFDKLLLLEPQPALGDWANFPDSEGFAAQIELLLRCRARS